jgi:di/tripeptidase
VEGSGGSDGTDLQKSMLPIDWCFIGAAEQHVHTPNELVNKEDIRNMIDLYSVLMELL